MAQINKAGKKTNNKEQVVRGNEYIQFGKELTPDRV